MVTFARRWRLSDQKIRTKLTLLLVLPLLAIVTLAGLNVTSEISASTSAQRARQLVVLGTMAADLVERLQSERAAAVLVFESGAGSLAEYQQQTAASDLTIERFREQGRRSSSPKELRSSMPRIDGDFGDLDSVRQQVLSAPHAEADVVAVRYHAIIADLLQLRESLSQVDGVNKIAGRLRATAALGNAAEALGMVQTTVIQSLAADRLTPAAQREIITADIGFTEAIADFRRFAPASWISRYNRQVAGPDVTSAQHMHGIVVRTPPGRPPQLGTDARGWATAVRTRIGLLHALATDLDSHLVTDIEQQRNTARRDVGVMAGAVGAAVLGMIAFLVAITRSLTRSLTGLSAAAETIAHTRLPNMVAQLSAGTVDLDRTRRLVSEIAESIPVLGRDEVGQVTTAFNAVTASAVRLAGEQAALQGGIRAIFNSLSRRSQRRLNTVMASLDSLQAKETDPDQLTLLFRLDHAATGLRRLTAGLQVLAGGRAGLIRPEPMALSAVLCAAQSEIDQYQRIDIGTVDDDVEIHGETVEEVIHLLAELLDNAARFSAPDTLVVIDGRRVGDLLHLQITDAGKGMTDEQLAAARDRLANPHRLDHHTAQQMGLPVVSAIADRLRITVDLRRAVPHGTRVDLTLPPALFRTVSSASSGTRPRLAPAEAESGAFAPTVEVPALSAARQQPLAPVAGAAAPAPREALLVAPAGAAGPVPAGVASIDPLTQIDPLAQQDAAQGSLAQSSLAQSSLAQSSLAQGSGWPTALSWPGQPATDQAAQPRPTAPRPAQPAAGRTIPAQPAQPSIGRTIAAQPAQPPAGHTMPAHPGEPIPAALPEPTAEFYQELKHAWFGGDTAEQQWTFSGAEPPDSEAAEFTSAGLPRRRRGPRPMPEPTPAPQLAGERATAEFPPIGNRRNRDSEQLRRRYAGLDRGLMTARRRSQPRPTEEEQ